MRKDKELFIRFTTQSGAVAWVRSSSICAAVWEDDGAGGATVLMLAGDGKVAIEGKPLDVVEQVECLETHHFIRSELSKA